MTQQNDQAYLIDINNVVYELVAEENHELHDMNGHIMASDPEDNLTEEIGRALAEEHVKPHTLAVCGPNGHPQQAWNIMRELQEKPLEESALLSRAQQNRAGRAE